MRKAAVVGAGKIGSTIASLLAGCGDYEVLVIDRSAEALAEIDKRAGTAAMAIDDPAALAKALAGCFAVVNAAPYHLTAVVAEAAKAAG
ncbi:MAG: saccharopine dehydrogenase, partial [Phenylobacterium sp.]|uniref:saccharopine dehydrogenase NADP-binding domain-containing protein n=1 Tax=Phenylobacterium sp. TaxID=1871053 RepID=UPI0026206CF7